ncbi:hypothetical protein [Tabrizicola sp.]|uniref:hypothetical protein n=1 Tax=Tabrizicola sp. TaxID=2005166 RepID=UPI00273499E0|nr:hypothetical protein [Tabrizicola sp.]MDP3197048.1 hypothetical protein [Tabrizicola sp.]
MRLALPLLFLAPMALAQEMTPDEFATFAAGRTLDYAVDGKVLGSEAYFPDRSVRDADTGGPCRSGFWYPDGPAVCFLYDGSDQRHCWLYWREGGKVRAKPLLSEPGDPVQTVTPAAAPLSCAAEVGV